MGTNWGCFPLTQLFFFVFIYIALYVQRGLGTRSFDGLISSTLLSQVFVVRYNETNKQKKIILVCQSNNAES